MGLKCGIVGLPNVGKSTFFNTMCQNSIATAANYPFCTIEPNKACIKIEDARLYEIAKIALPKKISPTIIDIIDIAGLVKGASKGEGCGNQFLQHISEVDLIIHLVRCFEDDNIAHVEGRVNPLQDIQTIETELILHDLQKLEKKQQTITKKAKSGQVEYVKELQLIEDLIEHLSQEKLVSSYKYFTENKKQIHNLFLLTAKPMMYVCNVNENSTNNNNIHTQEVINYAKNNNSHAIITCAKESNEETTNNKKQFIQNSINQIVQTAFKTLGFHCYFTAGEQEVKMWPIKIGTNAQNAAAVIHSDFGPKFIKAEVINYKNYLEFGERSKEKGLMKIAGKEYIVQDGDVIHFLINKSNK